MDTFGLFLIGMFVVFAAFVGSVVWHESSSKHNIQIECIKSGGELIENSCIRPRSATP